MSEIVDFITGVGFPIFVAVWMMYKTSEDSEKTRNALTDLKIAITTLTSEVAHHTTEENKNER